MTQETYTEDLARFGSRERKILADILSKPLPEGFSDWGVKPAMNMNSGYVFLVNDDCQCAMINSDTGNLELFHNTPHDGHEGFLSDLVAEFAPDDLKRDDVEYIRAAAKAEGFDLPKNWQE